MVLAIEKVNEVFSDFKFLDMRLQNITLDQIPFSKVREDNVLYSINNTFKNMGNGNIKHEIFLKNKLGIDKQVDFSIIIEILYDQVRWNGSLYDLGSVSQKLIPYDDKFGNLVVPNIFFGEENKRINFRDVADLGGFEPPDLPSSQSSQVIW